MMRLKLKLQTMLLMLRTGLLVTSLSGCASLPPVPHHVQYGIYPNVNPPGFYGVDNESKARVYRPFLDHAMSGGQCLTAQDYKSWSNWIQQIEEMARSRCR